MFLNFCTDVKIL